MKKLSNAALQIEGRPIFKVLADVFGLESQGKNIIYFEIGDPDYNELPRSKLRGIKSTYKERAFRSKLRGINPDEIKTGFQKSMIQRNA